LNDLSAGVNERWREREGEREGERERVRGRGRERERVAAVTPAEIEGPSHVQVVAKLEGKLVKLILA